MSSITVDTVRAELLTVANFMKSQQQNGRDISQLLEKQLAVFVHKVSLF